MLRSASTRPDEDRTRSTTKSLKTIAVTGANGFIGSELCALFEKRNFQVLKLTRTSMVGARTINWKLGEDLPEACYCAEAIVHLASATLGAVASQNAAYDADLAGTNKLINAVRACRARGNDMRFIFISSQSARPGAPTLYGRSKWAIEQLLDEPNEIIVRPGLVYGEPAASVFSLFKKLAALPILPIVHSAPAIQPIHVSELAQSIISLCELHSVPRLLQIGAPDPMTLEDAIRGTAIRYGLRAPTMVRIPESIVGFAARLIDATLRPTPSIAERVDGLLGLQAMETASSLNLLGLQLEALGTKQ